MTEEPLTLTRMESVLLLVCASFLAASGLYAWLVCEFTDGGLLILRAGAGEGLLSAVRDFPLLFLLSLAGGAGSGTLISITLRRQGFMDHENQR
ncbi:hypothetical protein P4910_23325 [Pantoea stewartii]|uniref:hypothetical protein n=1 Tax=Pantoea stewartii TaxID=66269 RepID=UPI0023F846AE|nr:hypothetical protein [Pantoea stewartii]MDF7788382.1 hypothetical protein [Pantoea stewartii]